MNASTIRDNTHTHNYYNFATLYIYTSVTYSQATSCSRLNFPDNKIK